MRASGHGFWANAIYKVLWFTGLSGVALYFGLFVRSMLRDPSLDHLIKLLFLWQTQTAGAFALVAALVGALAINSQTANARRSEEARRERRATALRASLPLTLAEVAMHMERTGRALAEWHGDFQQWFNTRHLISTTTAQRFTRLPTELLASIPGYMEVCAAGHERSLARLLRVIQIQQSRLRTLEDATEVDSSTLITTLHLEGAIIDAAEVYARCECLIEYARLSDDRPAPSLSGADVVRALFLMRLPGGLTDHLAPVVGKKATAVLRDGRAWLDD